MVVRRDGDVIPDAHGDMVLRGRYIIFGFGGVSDRYIRSGVKRVRFYMGLRDMYATVVYLPWVG